MARAVVVAVVASVMLVVGVYAVPVVSRLLADGGVPSPPALSTPEGSVQAGHSSPRPTGHTYVVRAGDTLRSIALTAYGNEARWRAIYRANRAAIRDPDALVVGTNLTIP